MVKFCGFVSATTFAFVVMFVFCRTSFAANTLNGCGGEVVEVTNTVFEQEVIVLVNQQRVEQGLAPLKYNADLANAARYLAKDMASDDYFAHDTYDRVDGELVKVCPWTERVKNYYPSPWAENAASGYTTPADVVNGWMNSQGHRANILSDNWETGVGFYDFHWVQDFGKRSDNYPAIINSEAITTSSTNVTLHIYGDWEQMRLRNDAGNWSTWQPFQSDVEWQLTGVQGIHAVAVEMLLGATTVQSRDEIELTASMSISNPLAADTPQLVFLPITLR
jgi:uncharacterized protein YkwD